MKTPGTCDQGLVPGASDAVTVSVQSPAVAGVTGVDGCGPCSAHRGTVRVVHRGRRPLGGVLSSSIGIVARVGVRLGLGPRLRSSLRRRGRGGGRGWCLVDRRGSAPRRRGGGRGCRARQRCGFLIATAARADEPTEDQDEDDQATASRGGVALLRRTHAALPRARYCATSWPGGERARATNLPGVDQGRSVCLLAARGSFVTPTGGRSCATQPPLPRTHSRNSLKIMPARNGPIDRSRSNFGIRHRFCGLVKLSAWHETISA
jgi:hypothetical protein